MAFNLTVGPMFVGKSEDLYNKALHIKRLGQIENSLAFIPTIDTRSKDDILTHNKKSVKSLGFNIIQVDNSLSLQKHIKPNTMFLLIDEMQFFDNGIVEFVKRNKQNIEIFGSGLDRTSENKDFGPMKELIEIADFLKVLCGECECGRLSTITKCIISKKDGEVLVGGSEKYKSVCMKCWES